MNVGFVKNKLAVCAAWTLTSAALASNAYAAFNLVFENHGKKDIVGKLLPDDNNCYEGSPPLGEVMDVPANGSYEMTLSRVGGNGCNGHQGEFSVSFSPAPANRSIQHFDFDNDNEMEVTGGRANAYPGTLKRIESDNRHPYHYYIYTLYTPPEITAGQSQGEWKLICQQICNNTAAIGSSIVKTTEETNNEELTRAIAVSLEAGVEFKGFSGKTTVTASEEKKVGHSMSQSVANGETSTDTRNYVFTPEQMRDFHIFAVWQWIAKTPLSDGTVFTVGSNKVTCTPDGDEPTYLPGSPKDLKACIGGQSN